jgi:hypothetical protein
MKAAAKRSPMPVRAPPNVHVDIDPFHPRPNLNNEECAAAK